MTKGYHQQSLYRRFSYPRRLSQPTIGAIGLGQEQVNSGKGNEMDNLEKLAETVAEDWKGDKPYYADSEAWVDKFWNAGSAFRQAFNRLDSTRIVELACGHGRHSAQMMDWPNTKILVDIVQENIDFCRQRFAGCADYTVYKNNGVDFSFLEGESQTSIFSYDAMVHFDHLVVFRYLQEAERVLVPGGKFLLHHSNFTENPGNDYRRNPSWRNFMPSGLIFDYAIKAGLVVEHHQTIPWGKHPSIDAITIVGKPLQKPA